MNTKFYFISALASMALLSVCSDNELASVETSQKTPIGFHTVVAKWVQELRLLHHRI